MDLPSGEGVFEQATLEGKYLITRTGKMIWATLVTKHKPIIIAREVLNAFCIRFEKLYSQELRELYSKFNGDISIFQRKSFYKVSVDMIINDEFYLHYTLPYKLGSKKGKDITNTSKTIYQLAKDISHQNKGLISLETLFSKAKTSLNLDDIELIILIYELIENDVLLPIPLERLKKKLAVQ